MSDLFRVGCLPLIIAGLVGAPAAADVAVPADAPRILVMDAPAVTPGERVEWAATTDQAARFVVETPSAGLLGVVARSKSSEDISLSITDGKGVPRPGGTINLDPTWLPHGEFGGVLVPAGRTGVTVNSIGGDQRGDLDVTFTPIADLPPMPVPSAWYEQAAVLTPGEAVQDHVRTFAQAVDEPHGEHRRVYYFRAAHAGPHTLNYTPAGEQQVFLEVYPATSMWEPLYDYEDAGGALVFTPDAGAGYFVVVDTWGYDDRLDFTLMLKTAGISARRRAPR